MESRLYNKLLEYGESDYYGFHMPGHKRNVECAKMRNPYSFDITEIEGFDNLHNPEGIILEEMEKAKAIYNSDKTYFLVNGSSGGNLAAISSVAKNGDKIIIARNSHKSVYNAVELLQLKVEYLYPRMIASEDIFASYDLIEVNNVLKNNLDAKALVITSPTYEGIVSDVEGICRAAHRYGIPVIVDGAHGAHFVLSEEFPKTAISCGADIVIESLHKTLPSLTQTAVLHYNSDLICQKKLEKYLSVYQTSSPSYVFMASICNCLQFVRNNGKEYGKKWIDRLTIFHKRMSCLQKIYILNVQTSDDIFEFDCSKIVIIIKDCAISGIELKNILNKKYHLEMEMASGNYVIAMTSVFDTEEGFSRLEQALLEIDAELVKHDSVKIQNQKGIYAIRNKKVCEIFETEEYIKKACDKKAIVDEPEVSELRLMVDSVASTYTYLYPPGIPVIVPGEVISRELKELLKKYQAAGYEVIIKE